MPLTGDDLRQFSEAQLEHELEERRRRSKAGEIAEMIMNNADEITNIEINRSTGDIQVVHYGDYIRSTCDDGWEITVEFRGGA